MIEAAGGLGFAIEALFERVGFREGRAEVDGLDGHRTIDQRVVGFIHDAHRPSTQFPSDFVAA